MIPIYTPPAELNTQALAPKRATLLVVDDQPVNIQLLYAILADDYEIIMATNGDDALRLCEELDPDLILLDIQMPGLSGFDVCQRIKESETQRDTPIIFITAQTKDSEETRCLRAGAVDFIAKPYNAEVVKARVRTHVRLKQQSDLLRSLAFIDPLTGLFNRRRLQEGLHAEWGRCRRSQVLLSLIMMGYRSLQALQRSLRTPDRRCLPAARGRRHACAVQPFPRHRGALWWRGICLSDAGMRSRGRTPQSRGCA